MSSHKFAMFLDESKQTLENKLGNRNPRYAETLKNLAVLYIATDRYDEAFNALTLAETIWSTKVGRRNNINTASIYLLAGDIYYRQRQYQKAEIEYNKAKVLYEKFFNDNHPEYVKVLSKLSKGQDREGEARKAKKSMEEVSAN